MARKELIKNVYNWLYQGWPELRGYGNTSFSNTVYIATTRIPSTATPFSRFVTNFLFEKNPSILTLLFVGIRRIGTRFFSLENITEKIIGLRIADEENKGEYAKEFVKLSFVIDSALGSFDFYFKLHKVDGKEYYRLERKA